MSDDERPFLDVRASLLGQVWRERLDARGRNTAATIAQSTEIPELIARILAARGVAADAAVRFLTPTVRELMPDPNVLTDMDAASERICAAIRRGERVAIFGDYDVDGAASAALLARFLRFFRNDPEIYIPDRIIEGYGPNPAAIAELAGRGATLIVTVDCGSASFEALEQAKKLGVDVVVIDHHQMDEARPPAVAVVNPNRQDDLSGLGYLCAAGVVFLVLVAVARKLRDREAVPDLLQWLDLVALATVCDVVALAGLNRAFVVKGLSVIRVEANRGLAALARCARLDGPIGPYHLGFMLGPRINAGGRIGDAALGARLLASDDASEIEAICAKLEKLNRERQTQEAAALESAFAQADAEIGEGNGPSVLVVEGRDWHPGIVGLVAARLKERYRRPAFALAFDPSGRATGSGRSVSGIDLGHAVREAVHAGILVKGGGHAMAAGITVTRERLADLRAFLEDRLGAVVQAVRDGDALKIDGALTARGATVEFCDLIEQAGPYGQGHPRAVFAFPAHAIRSPRIVGRDHVSFLLRPPDGASLRAVAFRAAGTALGQTILQAPDAMHVAGTLSAEWWQGSRRVQLHALDAALPDRTVR